MGRIGRFLLLAFLCVGCGWLPDAEGIASLLPTLGLPAAATLDYPDIATYDAGALTLQVTIVGTVLDQYGSPMPGVVICYGPSEEEAIAIGVTDSGGAYSAVLPASLSESEGNRAWAYLPLYRFEPDRVQVTGPLLGETTLDFKAYPSVYPVPPERDCR